MIHWLEFIRKYWSHCTHNRECIAYRNERIYSLPQGLPSERTGLAPGTFTTGRSQSAHQRAVEVCEDDHFDCGRFVLCWTGLSTQASKLTCESWNKKYRDIRVLTSVSYSYMQAITAYLSWLTPVVQYSKFLNYFLADYQVLKNHWWLIGRIKQNLCNKVFNVLHL